MILQSLNALYTRLASDPSYKISPPGFSPQKISFRVVIKADGKLFDIQDARTPNEKGKLMTSVIEVPGNAKPPGSGINPCFLWDNQTYLLGRQPDGKKDRFGFERFAAFKQRHLELESEIESERFSLVCRFLESWEPDLIPKYPKLDVVGTGFGVFQIQGHPGDVHQDEIIREWWQSNRPVEDEDDEGQCLVTGEIGQIARLHPKIKGVANAQSAGASIVSFNDTAYESYGMNQGENAPIGRETAFRYGTALNSLLGGPQSKKHRLRIGDTTAVFWTEKSHIVEDAFAEILGGSPQHTDDPQDRAQRDRIERVLKAVRIGGKFQDLGDATETPFYILGLAPNAARLSIRFFYRSTVSDLLKHLHSHQRVFETVREFTEQRGKRPPDAEFPAIWQILRETARVSDEIPPLLAGALTRAIVEGCNYPEALLTAIIRRIHADRTINYLRAATLKALLTRNHKQSIPVMLDTANTTPAYLLGRLFSALEKTQEDALGSLNAGIRDRYYSSASSTPASVFPRLLRTYQHHLKKLSIGAKTNREILIQEIISSFTEFPTQLNLKNQGLFSIGYYHQRKDFFTKKEKPKELAQTVKA